MYAHGHLCLAAIYNRTPELPPNHPSWETQPNLIWAFHNILLMLSKAKKEVSPLGFGTYAKYAEKDPRKYKWEYHWQ